MAEEKKMCFCSKCKKLMKEDNFYSYKDGTKTELCKPCFTMHIDNFNPDTFLWALEKLDVPYVPAEWNVLRDRAYAKDPMKVNGMSVLGKYLSKMKLKQWREYGWADSEKLQAASAEKEAEKAAELEAEKERIQQAYDDGKITDAEYKTYMDSQSLHDNGEIEKAVLRDVITGRAIEAGLYDPTGQSSSDTVLLDENDLPDFAASLTKEDKVYLALKWGRTYSAEEWVSLEQNYKDMCKDFDITDQDTKNTLLLLCKINLKENQLIDQGDFDGASKLARMYDSTRKSAKFTAAQNKEKQEDFVSSVGELIKYCEKEGGRIPRFQIDYNYDIIDKEEKDMKEYLRNLFNSDPSIPRQIEDYLKAKTLAEERRARKTEVEPLDEQDHFDYDNHQEQLRESGETNESE